MYIEQEIKELKERVENLEKVLNLKNVVIQKSQRDRTKFLFENKIYAKNQFVLAVVKKYIQENNPNFENLSNIFNKSLQGALNVVETKEGLRKISDASKRYFTNNMITLCDGVEIAVCTQWGIFNIANIERLANKLGYNVERIYTN